MARFVSAKLSATATHDHIDCTLLLSLCTQHKIEMILFFVVPPKVAKASNYVAVALAGDIAVNFANGNTA